MQTIIIPKEIINYESDQKIYLFQHKVYNKYLKYICKFKNYYVYHLTFNFNIQPFLNQVLEYIEESFKENNQNYLNTYSFSNSQ